MASRRKKAKMVKPEMDERSSMSETAANGETSGHTNMPVSETTEKQKVNKTEEAGSSQNETVDSTSTINGKTAADCLKNDEALDGASAGGLKTDKTSKDSGSDDSSSSNVEGDEEKCTKDCKPGFPNPCPLRGGDAGNLSCVQVHKILRDMGIKKPENTSRCVKAAIQNGSIDLKGEPASLNVVLATGKADGSDECRHRLKATLGQLLDQADLGGDEYGIDYDGATVNCTKGDCPGSTYVTQMCEGSFIFENGKYHNHCPKCPGFGECIGDFKVRHCSRCKTHYFAGRSGQFKCCSKGKAKAKEDSDNAGLDFDRSDECSDFDEEDSFEEIGNDSSFEPPWAEDSCDDNDSSD